MKGSGVIFLHSPGDYWGREIALSMMSVFCESMIDLLPSCSASRFTRTPLRAGSRAPTGLT